MYPCANCMPEAGVLASANRLTVKEALSIMLCSRASKKKKNTLLVKRNWQLEDFDQQAVY